MEHPFLSLYGIRFVRQGSKKWWALDPETSGLSPTDGIR